MKKIKNSKIIAKEKNTSYNNDENVIFKELPKIQERNKKTYLITFIILLVFMYSGWETCLMRNIFNINDLSQQIRFTVNIIKFSIAIIYAAIILKNTLKRDMKYYMKNFKKYLKYGLATLVVFGVIERVVGTITLQIVGSMPENETFVRVLPLIYQIVFSIFLGPIIEEGIFRGLLRKVITNKYLFIILSSLIFGSMHVIFDFKNPLDLLYIFVYSVSSFALAYNYAKTDNLISPIIMHIINNLLATIIVTLI